MQVVVEVAYLQLELVITLVLIMEQPRGVLYLVVGKVVPTVQAV
jgi:hypothetical protein